MFLKLTIIAGEDVVELESSVSDRGLILELEGVRPKPEGKRRPASWKAQKHIPGI